MVGAGGIGVVLYEAIRSFNYAQTAAVMIIVIVIVSLIDLASGWVRERVI
jgi:phosphonate transport system permease protein